MRAATVICSCLVAALAISVTGAGAQELYVFSEPASNMPARAMALKASGKFLNSIMTGRTDHRQKLYASFGLDRKWMLRAGTTLSNMYSSPDSRWESVNLYAKYRFHSNDGVHRHFRAAAFLEASHSRNGPMFDEISLEGDQSGLQAGIVLTQLIHKLAVSTTLGWTEVLQDKRWDKQHAAMHPYRSLGFSLSAGYLLLPVRYRSYRQTNLNLYIEMMGARNPGRSQGYLDMAPALQLIFNSNTKLNAGYRFALGGDMYRMAQRSLLFSVETTFLNVLRTKSRE
jgi:hypothetical protein